MLHKNKLHQEFQMYVLYTHATKYDHDSRIEALKAIQLQ